MGLLINIEGTDGSGKATQTKLLMDSLIKRGMKVATLDFPRYQADSSLLVRQYLAGKFGQADEVSAKTASAFFAFDRYLTAPTIRSLLQSNDVVILDRYVAANKGHQLGKIDGNKQRAEFLNWLNELEYGENKIPVPDMTILLYLPISAGANNFSSEAKGGVAKDIHESDKEHLKKAEEAYLWVAKHDTYENWQIINCLGDDGSRLLPDSLHTLVWNSAIRSLVMV